MQSRFKMKFNNKYKKKLAVGKYCRLKRFMSKHIFPAW